MDALTNAPGIYETQTQQTLWLIANCYLLIAESRGVKYCLSSFVRIVRRRSMSCSRVRSLAASALLFQWFLLGCGASVFVSVNNGRLLVVVSVNPNSVDPVNLPDGQVQFTAMGTFNTPPTTVDPMTNVTWTIDRPAFSMAPDSGNAFINANGVAHCAQGFIGMVQVFATAPANPNQPVSMNNQVVGTATLSCP
jgi:hypothetical protein